MQDLTKIKSLITLKNKFPKLIKKESFGLNKYLNIKDNLAIRAEYKKEGFIFSLEELFFFWYEDAGFGNNYKLKK